MVLRAVPVELLDRFLGGEATREVIKRCTTGPVVARKGRNGSFVFPLVHPQAVRHAEGLGISPHIEADAFLYLKEGDGAVEYVVAVGENRAIVGYGAFEQMNGRTYLLTATRLKLWYAYEAGSIRITRIDDGSKNVYSPLQVVEIKEEELERLVEKYASKGAGEEEVKRRIAEQAESFRREIARLGEQNKRLEARLGEMRTALAKSEPSPYLTEITLEKGSFQYDLAKSLMRRCVERKRYTKDDMVGLGLKDDALTYVLYDAVINAYVGHVGGETDVIKVIEPTENSSSSAKQRRRAVLQFYNIKLEHEYADLFPSKTKFKKAETIPAIAVLFFQLMSFGGGPKKSPERIQAQLGFTPEQVRVALEQGLLTGSETGIERVSLNQLMKEVYMLFMTYRRELYPAVTES